MLVEKLYIFISSLQEVKIERKLNCSKTNQRFITNTWCASHICYVSLGCPAFILPKCHTHTYNVQAAFVPPWEAPWRSLNTRSYMNTRLSRLPLVQFKILIISLAQDFLIGGFFLLDPITWKTRTVATESKIL